jgi:hypothetical protein
MLFHARELVVYDSGYNYSQPIELKLKYSTSSSRTSFSNKITSFISTLWTVHSGFSETPATFDRTTRGSILGGNYFYFLSFTWDFLHSIRDRVQQLLSSDKNGGSKLLQIVDTILPDCTM